MQHKEQYIALFYGFRYGIYFSIAQSAICGTICYNNLKEQQQSHKKNKDIIKLKSLTLQSSNSHSKSQLIIYLKKYG